jgi:hypothetical protein
MYCHYCGRPAVSNCPACGHRICGDHKRPWLVLVVCTKCYRSMWVGAATALAVAVGIVAVCVYAMHG